MSEQDLLLQLEMLRAVVDGMSEGLWITDPDGRVVQHNNALKELLYSGTDLVGKNAAQLVKRVVKDKARGSK
jgi:two-component system phosphate regulon sensor histidine kinase PhoR